jgi:hypothetical protein
VSYDYAADSRSRHGIYSLTLKVGGQPLTGPLGVSRMLKHQRALEVTRTVEPGCELEMAFEKSAGLLKKSEQISIRLQFIDLR